MIEILIADLANPRLWLLVLLVSGVGLIEKLAFYQAGKRSSGGELPNVPGIDEDRAARVKSMFETRGSYILLLASIPGVGAATTAVAGMVGVAVVQFVIWVTISNLIRNWLIVILSGQLATLF